MNEIVPEETPNTPHTITQRELVDVFRTLPNEGDHRFCFLTGAGASVTSGIRAAGAVAKEWLAQLKERLGPQFKEWMAEERIDEERPDESYTKIYKRRFLAYPPEGHVFLENEMQDKAPTIGYALFALLLDQSSHSFVITTNFDSLLEESIQALCKKRPLVCGHEHLATYIRPHVTRPTVVKVHRDLLLDPFNTPAETQRLKEQWVNCPIIDLDKFPNGGDRIWWQRRKSYEVA